MKTNIIGWFNGTLFVFLLASMLLNILSTYQNFGDEKDTKEARANAIKQREKLESKMSAHDSLVNIKLNAILSNQIESHDLYREMIKQNDSLIKLLNKISHDKSVSAVSSRTLEQIQPEVPEVVSDPYDLFWKRGAFGLSATSPDVFRYYITGRMEQHRR